MCLSRIVQEAFHDVYNNGYILTESVEQLLCQKCDRFLADRYVMHTIAHVPKIIYYFLCHLQIC